MSLAVYFFFVRSLGAFAGKPLEYHALGGQPFWIPSTEKYTIVQVKPLQGQPAHIATNNKIFNTLAYLFIP